VDGRGLASSRRTAVVRQLASVLRATLLWQLGVRIESFPLHLRQTLRPVETRKGVSCRLAVQSQFRGVSANAVPDLIRKFPFPATVSLRIAGDWRADHARDVVDSEPKMTKALLIAGGGFIPDEDRILRPADRPGRPPFLRPVGANQSRDDRDGAHPAHRHLARLHDVAVLNTCHMVQYRTRVQCRANHATSGRAGLAMAPGKRWQVHRMQLGSVSQVADSVPPHPGLAGGVGRHLGSRYPTLACTAFPAKESRTRCGLRRSAQGDWQRGDHRRFRAGR